MKTIKKFKFSILLIFALFAFVPFFASAHQPEIVDSTSNEIIVTNPEISKAYYAELSGQPHFYRINSSEPFDLYVNTLVPDIEGQRKDFIAYVIKINSESKQHLATLDGTTYEWKNFFEPFGYDNYWMGPEYKMRAESGEYEIQVINENNYGKYALAIGETESFGLANSFGSIGKIIKNKKEFFGTSPINFILSLLGYGYIIVMFILSFIFGFLYRLILKRVAKNSVRKVSQNIGKNDRWVRAGLGLFLLIFAISTSWSPILLFFAGFCFFEAIFSWCGFYAAIGKNSCSV